MATLLEITAGIKGVLNGQDGGIAGLRGHAVEPTTINPPCAWPFLRQPAATFGNDFGGDMTWFFTVYVLVGSQSDQHAQSNLMPYLAASGAKSVAAAFDADPSLGGLAGVNATVTGIESVGSYEFGGNRYIGAALLVQVLA